MDHLRGQRELAGPGDGRAVPGAPRSSVTRLRADEEPAGPSRRAFLAAGLGCIGSGAAQALGLGRAVVRAAPSVPHSVPQEPLLLKAAINGARAAGSHPALPVTPEECGRAAAACVEAGAGAIHVHVRRSDGSQSLEADDVARTLAAVRASVSGTPVGVSTLLGIVGDAGRRQALVESWTTLPDFASVNFNEEGCVPLAELLMARGVGVEAGLFDSTAARACVDSGLASRCLRLMLEPRRGALEDVLRSVEEMEAVLDEAGVSPPRLLHGFRDVAWTLIEEAARRGHQTRAGLEDTYVLPDGATARDNAEVVARAARLVAATRGSA